ncbi:SIMPL domain-containing protein [Rhodococcoides yunnanense]|uniref:SIMPL domain-containing protein n=1 Tax=Rhodococcoides yunnanense TaxID=278209 RepID=UPI000932C101|nr:SIMPL domain-containing protein [Rhodococcus yunnanensis]
MDSHPVEITVVGEARATFMPDRCTVSLAVRTDGRSAEAAAEPAHRLVEELTGLIVPLYNESDGPIDAWSLDQVRHSRNRPFNQDGEQLAYVYHAVATIDVKFSQIDVIDAFVYAVSALNGVDVGHFEWSLTDDNAAEKTRDVRTLAVLDAVEKAEIYAQSVGRTAITALAIADPGLLGVGAATPEYALAARAYTSADDGFELKPQAITIRAQVHARFAAS